VDAVVCIKGIAYEPPRPREGRGPPGFERVRSARLAINESDAYAIDAAVQLRKQHGGRVTAVTVGPLETQDVLYTALAKGADAALRVDAEPEDPLQVAELLAAVARRGGHDLILTGIECHETLASAVAPAIAARLDLPFASSVDAIELAPGESQVRVRRELGGGAFQTLEMPLPAVFAVQSGICRLSYPPAVRVLQARRRPPRSLSAAALGVELAAPEAELAAISTPRLERVVEMVEGTPAEMASALLDRIEGALCAS
jgi:electron transfer flavoprotein beta subunit